MLLIPPLSAVCTNRRINNMHKRLVLIITMLKIWRFINYLERSEIFAAQDDVVYGTMSFDIVGKQVELN